MYSTSKKCINRQLLYLISKYNIYLAAICTDKHSSICPSICSTNNHWAKHHVRSLIRPFVKSPTILLKSSNPTVQSSNNILILSGLTIIHPYACLIYLPTIEHPITHFFIHPATFPSVYTDAFIHPSTFPHVNLT